MVQTKEEMIAVVEQFFTDKGVTINTTILDDSIRYSKGFRTLGESDDQLIQLLSRFTGFTQVDKIEYEYNLSDTGEVQFGLSVYGPELI